MHISSFQKTYIVSVGISYVCVCYKSIGGFFGMEASFDLSYSVLMCYNEIQVSTKIRVLPSGTLL